MTSHPMTQALDADLYDASLLDVPYPPSGIDRFTDWVRRLPIPYWLTYLFLFLLQSALVLVLSWIDGWLPAFTFSPLVMIFALWLWGPLAIVTYLDAVSLDALDNFRPLLDVPDDAMRRLRYEFTVMPQRGVVITSLLWSLMYLGFTAISFGALYEQFEIGMPLTIFVIIQGLITYAIGSVIYYHSIRQLNLVNRTVGLVDHFDLFRLEPVYAFSVLTSRTGVCWIILLSLTLLFFPIELAPGPVLVLLGLQAVLVIAAFVLPLRMVNRCLELEKRRLLSELDQRLKSILIRLHNAVDEESLEPNELEVLNQALAGLTTEREIVTRIPTWPWRPGLLGGFLSIAVLPIILFVVQLALEKWLGW